MSRARYYRDTVRGVALLLLRNAVCDPVPASHSGPNSLVRLWRFTDNKFECVFEIPWDELPLRDNSLPEHQQQGSPCGHYAEEGQTEEESRDAWWKQHQEWLKQYKPVEIDQWDSYSDVWTTPPWISAVSMRIDVERGGEISQDVMGCGRHGNAEDGGTLMLYPASGLG